MSLIITGPDNYYHFDSQSINIATDSVNIFSFAWNIPAVAGTYGVEVNLVPIKMSAFDATC